MAFYLVTMTHNNLDGWTQHLQSHIAFLRQMLEEGSLRASGPLPEAPVRGGFLIVKADTRAAVDALIARDPFSTEGLIDGLKKRGLPESNCYSDSSADRRRRCQHEAYDTMPPISESVSSIK